MTSSTAAGHRHVATPPRGRPRYPQGQGAHRAVDPALPGRRLVVKFHEDSEDASLHECSPVRHSAAGGLTTVAGRERRFHSAKAAAAERPLLPLSARTAGRRSAISAARSAGRTCLT